MFLNVIKNNHLFKKLERKSLKHQILAFFLIAIATLALVTSIAVSWQSTQLAVKRAIQQGLSVTDALARNSTLALVYGSEETATEAIEFVLSFPGVEQAAITDAASGAILSQHGSVRDWHEQSYTMTSESAVLEYQDNDYWQFGSQVVVRSGASDSPFELDTPTIQILGRVHVMISKNQLKQLKRTIILGNFSISLFLCLILFLILTWVIERTTGPFADFAVVMERAQKGERGLRLEKRGASELITMAEAFNRMMTVLEEREDELVQARDAALESSRLKSEFVANVSHEIRTPMNGVLGMLNLLDEERFSPEEKGYLSVAKQSGQSLLGLINSILDFSKLNADQVTLDEERINLEALLENTLALYSGYDNKASVELGLVYESNVPVYFWGDASRIQQLMNNLISNSVKFTEAGSVVISVGLLEEQEDLCQLQLEVQDTGIGIPSAYLDQLFEPYSQQDGSINRRFGGTGLGLAICKRLVELMGGSIKVSSTEGKGSRFIISLPLKKQHEVTLKRFPIKTHFDRFLLLAPKGLHKDLLVNLMGRWQMPYVWLDSLEDWERLFSKDAEQYKWCFLINWPGELTPFLSDLQIIQSRLNVCVLAYQLPFHEKTSHDKEDGQLGEGLQVGVDLKVSKPVRRFNTEDSLRSYVDSVSSQNGKGSLGGAKTFGATSGGASEVTLLNHKILIVEDNAVNQKVAKAHLKKLGLESDLACNGEEAVKAVQNHQYDLVLMDCQMPVLDGFEATRQIRANGYDAEQLPIIALSANTRDDDQEQCYQAGMNGFIGKPFTREQLSSELRKWFPEVGG